MAVSADRRTGLCEVANGTGKQTYEKLLQEAQGEAVASGFDQSAVVELCSPHAPAPTHFDVEYLYTVFPDREQILAGIPFTATHAWNKHVLGDQSFSDPKKGRPIHFESEQRFADHLRKVMFDPETLVSITPQYGIQFYRVSSGTFIGIKMSSDGIWAGTAYRMGKHKKAHLLKGRGIQRRQSSEFRHDTSSILPLIAIDPDVKWVTGGYDGLRRLMNRSAALHGIQSLDPIPVRPVDKIEDRRSVMMVAAE